MKKLIALYASSRYWNNETELKAAYGALAAQMKDIVSESILITTMEDVAQMPEADCLVIVPMSGGVQPLILESVTKYNSTVIYAMYIIGNTTEEFSDKMIMKNAAPTVMDTWAVIRREHAHGSIAISEEKLKRRLKVYEAYHSLKGATILLIGNTEPWVVSNSKNRESYEKLGVTVKQIEQEEVARLYREMTDEDARVYYDYFKGNEKKIVEPTEEDINASAKMTAALVKTVDKYKPAGIALACFNLLAEGTNMCLGVSYINDRLPQVAACEGDVDSAVTMLLMKRLTSSKLWMANPNLHPDGTVNFSHCTAPLDLFNNGFCPYILRNHHESGIGTSLQVEYPIGQRVTACRLSDEAGKITIHQGTTVQGKYESGCRTQVYVKFDDFDHYLDTALGCHQVFAFEDIEEELKMLAQELKLVIL